MSKIVYEAKGNYELKFGGDDFNAILSWVKTVLKARYDPGLKRWLVPVNEETTRLLRGNRWKFLGTAYIKKIDTTKAKEFPPPTKRTLKSYDDSGHVLSEFQNEAVSFGISRKDNWLLALPPGSGKGVIGSAWLSLVARRSLVICPAGMKVHWSRELKKWADYDSIILEGETPHEIDFKLTDAYIINYEILPYWYASLKGKCEHIIVDECQKIANPPEYSGGKIVKEAKATKAVISLCRNAIGKCFISGTPGRDRPRKLFTTLNLIDPLLFSDRMAFYNRYCDPKEGFRGTVTYDGYTNEEELHGLLKHYMYRKTKKEIMPFLPKKNKIIYLMDVVKSKGLIKAEKALEAAEERGESCHKEMEEVCWQAFLLKKELIWQKIDTWLDENPNEKIIIAAYHTEPITQIFERYKDIAVCISGKTASGKRQGIVDAFQTDPKVRMMVAQIQAAGTGFTMTASRTMLFAEMWWMPDDLLQMEDRQHRITSTGDHVDYIYCIAAGTKEEDMLKAVNKKTSGMSRVMDGEETEFFGEDE